MEFIAIFGLLNCNDIDFQIKRVKEGLVCFQTVIYAKWNCKYVKNDCLTCEMVTMHSKNAPNIQEGILHYASLFIWHIEHVHHV